MLVASSGTPSHCSTVADWPWDAAGSRTNILRSTTSHSSSDGAARNPAWTRPVVLFKKGRPGGEHPACQGPAPHKAGNREAAGPIPGTQAEGWKVIELLALGFAAFVVFAVVSALLGVAALVFWVVLLPFRLLGFAFKALGALLFLPALLIGGLVIAALVGIPLLFMALLPVLPIALLVAAIWWLTRRGLHRAAPVR